MKEATIISLGGIVLALEADAKTAINHYLDKNRAKLAGDEAVDEIMEDLEHAIAGHLLEAGFSDKRAASKTDVDKVLKLMGEVTTEETENKKPHQWQDIFKQPFHLSKTNHVVFGLAGGIAEQMGIDAFWVRIAFILFAIWTNGWFIALYFIAGIVIGILDDGKKVDAQTVSEQFHKTSKKLSSSGGKTLHAIDVTLRRVFRALSIAFNGILLVAFIGLLSWAIVAMSVRPAIDLPFIGTLRSSLAYIFVVSGILTGILAFGLSLAQTLLRKPQASSNNKVWWALGTVLPVTIALSTFAASGTYLRSTIADWGNRHPGNGFVEIQHWQDGKVKSWCVSPLPTCEDASRPVEKVIHFNQDGTQTLEDGQGTRPLPPAER